MKTALSILFTLLFSISVIWPAGHNAWAGEHNFNKTSKKAQSAGDFTRVMDDLPLMPGLKITREKDVLIIFGPNRLADTTATGMVDVDDVYTFYRDTLPELGWKYVDARTYERENEVLHIDAKSTNKDGIAVVRFSTTPAQ